MVDMERLLLLLLAMAMAMAASLAPAEAQLLTREDLAPLLHKKVVIPTSAKTPHATPWPAEFTIGFTTDGGAVPGMLAYDWERQQQAIAHGAGSTHCRARGSAGECYILENARGTFEVDFERRSCELTNVGVGTVAPDWTKQGVFAGVEEVRGVQCNRFQFPPSVHVWLETVDGGLPCSFVFPNYNMTYFFDQRSLKLGKPEADLFTLPDYCPREPLLRADQ